MRFTMRDGAPRGTAATKPTPDVEAKSGSDPELDTDFYSDDTSSMGKSDILGREEGIIYCSARRTLSNTVKLIRS